MMLPKKDFDTFIRWVKTGAIDRVAFIRNASFRNLRRVGAPRDLNKAVEGIPAGSDQYDGMTLVKWMESVQPNQKRAIWQLQALDATAVKRSS